MAVGKFKPEATVTNFPEDVSRKTAPVFGVGPGFPEWFDVLQRRSGLRSSVVLCFVLASFFFLSSLTGKQPSSLDMDNDKKISGTSPSRFPSDFTCSASY